MTAKRAHVAASAATALTAAIVSVVAYWSLPAGEWAYVDRPFDPDIPARVGEPLEEGVPYEIGVEVPDTGVGRIDLRFAVSAGSPVLPELPEGAAVTFRLEADSGALLWESILSLADLAPEGTALVFPEVMPGVTSAVTLSVALEQLGPDIRVSLWEVPCDCSDLVSGGPGSEPGGVESAVDPDAVVYSRAVGRVDRFRLALHRIDRIHPTGFGKWAVIAWGSLAATAALALTWALSFALFRTELPGFREQGTRPQAGSQDPEASHPPDSRRCG